MSEVVADKVSALRKARLFQGLPEGALATLATRMERQRFRPNQVILHQGDVGAALYIITHGLVKITVLSPEGQEAILAFLPAGELFGELALLDSQPRSASAIAMEATETLVLGRKEFLAFLQEQPGTAFTLMKVLSQRLRRANDHIATTMLRDMPARIAKKLVELAGEFGQEVEDGTHIDLRLRQQDIANMVGASRESVSRCLTLLQQRGLIKLEKHHVTVLRLDKLREWAT